MTAREQEIEQVQARLGFDRVYRLGFPTTRLDAVLTRDLVGAISAALAEFRPTEVLVPHRGDVHSDHRVVFDAVITCIKPFRSPGLGRVMAYETPSETEQGLAVDTAFRPNVFVDIGDYLEAKIEALGIYRSELGAFPFPRSEGAVRALAQWRGSTAGFLAAEAFELLRERG
jgi:LmbE family N-acetylglucosaminyl deacetylase